MDCGSHIRPCLENPEVKPDFTGNRSFTPAQRPAFKIQFHQVVSLEKALAHPCRSGDYSVSAKANRDIAACCIHHVPLIKAAADM